MKQLCRKMLFASAILFASFQISFAQLPSTNTFPPTGKAGIGTTNPLESIHIKEGTIMIDDMRDIPTPTNPTVEKYTMVVFDELGRLQKATNAILEDIGIILPGPAAGGLYWKLNGNDTVLSFHYLGTNNLADLRIKTNSLERMTITSDGFINAGLVNALKGMNVSVVSADPSGAGLLVETDNMNGGYGVLSNVTNSSTKALSVQRPGSEDFYVKGNGEGYFSYRLGVGVINPSTALHVSHNDPHGGIILNRNSAVTGKSQVLFQQAGVEKWAIGTDMIEDNSNNFFISDKATDQTRLFIDANGNVGIGTTNVGLTTKLAVEGKICAREIKVLTGAFPDYVFEKEYNLMSLKELEVYINAHKHLPGIPSAREVEANQGVDLGEMNRLLLEKVEELTLHLIELDKSNTQLQKEMEALKGQQAK